MSDLRVCTIEHGGKPVPGVMGKARVAPLAEAYRALGEKTAAPESTLALLAAIEGHRQPLSRVAAALDAGDAALAGAAVDLGSARLRPPLMYPRTIFAAGGNYRDHQAEMRNGVSDKAKDMPYFFAKPVANTVIGPGDAVIYPKYCEALDWEVEIAVVMGRDCLDVPPDWNEVRKYIAGYTMLIDMSVRKFPRHPLFGADWVVGKAFDTAAPMGPAILLDAPDVDPMDLDMKLSVNGVTKQDSNTSKMIYNITEQVSWLSRNITLTTGDVITTGTPSGVGAGRNEFLKVGDRVHAEIERIGAIDFPIVARQAG